jgi:chromosome partitioning protein
MKVWVTANQKGGVGKTTTAVSMGGLLAERGERVLLIDLDPHASMTAYFDLDPEQIEYSAFDIFMLDGTDESQCIISTKVQGIDIIAGNLALATLDKRLSKLDGKGLIIKKLVDRLNNDYDHIIIDCPPILGILMINALAACNHLLIPVQTEFLALKGLERMITTLEMIRHAGKSDFTYTIVPTMFDRRTTASVTSLRKIRDDYPHSTWHAVIPIDTKLRDASKANLPPCIFDSSSRGSEAYARLLRDIESDNNYMVEAKAS